MVYIKDKYRGKGAQIRSNFIARQKDSAKKENAPTGLTNQQRDQIATENFRSFSNETARGQSLNMTGASTLATNQLQSKIRGFKIEDANVALRILDLQQGSSLNNIVIHNHHTSEANINIYWSPGDQTRATFDISTGFITSFKGISLINLYGDNFSANATVSLEGLVQHTYRNISNPITFYAVSSVVGPSITISSTDELSQ
mgnify:CR=1 FL=1|tara:strand:- start:5649 stop:6251 length:603 start_codon:yes stop_codon:yes gene_type:complete